MKNDDHQLLDDLEVSKGNTIPARNRHGCLTAYLILVIVTNTVFAIASFVFGIQGGGQSLEGLELDAFTWFFMAVDATLLTAMAVAILFYKRWGVIGFCIIVGINGILGVVGGTASTLVGAAIGIAIVIGFTRKNWDAYGW